MKNKKRFWKCQCDCGNIIDVYYYNLIIGKTQSCGCLRQDVACKHAKKINLESNNHIKDISNQQFGLLIAKNLTSKRQGRGAIWHCICSCGNTKDVSEKDLVSGNVQSCGCLHSKGEGKIKQLLQNNNIPFKEEKIFDNCVFPDTKGKPRFDFYIDDKYIIEYDGSQHFKYTETGWNTKEHFDMVQKRDAFKNEYCKKHNIPLIRIPYTHYNNLCIEDLKLETSSFIIK